MQYFPFYINDYKTSLFVATLNDEEEICYLRLLMYLYDQDGKVPFTTEVLRVIFRRKRKDKLEIIWRKLKDKFEIIDGYITQPKVTRIIANAEELRSKKSYAGKKSGEARLKKANICSSSVRTILNTKAKAKAKEEYINNIDNSGVRDYKRFSRPTLRVQAYWQEQRGLSDIHYSGDQKYNELMKIEPYVTHIGAIAIMHKIDNTNFMKIGYVLNALDQDEQQRQQNTTKTDFIPIEDIEKAMAEMILTKGKTNG